MAAKLALHILPGPNDPTSLIQSAPWPAVKSVNNTAPLAVAAAAGIPVRIFRDTSTDAASSTDAANILLAHDLTHTTHLQICCESARGGDPIWQTEVYYGLRNGGFSGGFIVGNFATGNPTEYDTTTHADGSPHFPALLPLVLLLQRHGVLLGVDEYTGIRSTDPRVPAWWPWTAQRHRYQCHCLHLHGADPQVVITESGGDNVLPELSGGGWQTRGWTPAAYWGTLVALDTGDQQDAAVLCRCVFASNPTPDWAGYDIAPIAADLAAYVRAQAITPPQSLQNGSGDTKGLQVLQGIDVSSMQPGSDWPLIAQTHQFEFTKATEGAGYINPLFARDWAGAAAAGLVRGAYHFARPDINSATAEADYFLAAVGSLSPGDMLVLDLEVGSGDLSGWAQAWLERVAARVGFKPIIYTYPSFVTEHGLGTVALAAYPLWYASYQQQWPPIPGQWASIAIWQHSDNAVVPGVAGIVDESYTTLTIDELKALGKPAPVSGGTMDAITYYQQLGVKVATDHAIFTVALKPLYDFAMALKAKGDPLTDLVMPGPLTYPEYEAVHGNGQQAACVKLSNRIVGCYLDTDGSWRPYQASLA